MTPSEQGDRLAVVISQLNTASPDLGAISTELGNIHAAMCGQPEPVELATASVAARQQHEAAVRAAQAEGRPIPTFNGQPDGRQTDGRGDGFGGRQPLDGTARASGRETISGRLEDSPPAPRKVEAERAAEVKRTKQRA